MDKVLIMMREDYADEARGILGSRRDEAALMRMAGMGIITRPYASIKERAKFAF